MRILNQYVVKYDGQLMILLETTSPVDEHGYGKYYTVSRDFVILPLCQDEAASLIYK